MISLNLIVDVIFFSVQFGLLIAGYVSAVVTRHASFLLPERVVFMLELTVVPAQVAAIGVDSSVEIIGSTKRFGSAWMSFCKLTVLCQNWCIDRAGNCTQYCHSSQNRLEVHCFISKVVALIGLVANKELTS